MPTATNSPLPIAVIGGGPAGLMAAETLAAVGAPTHLYEAMPSVGRKFLIAGKGGLNITHAEPLEQFLNRYGLHRPQIEPHLRAFGPAELRAWLHELGFESFVGTSGKVFPTVMKAGPVLHAWRARLRAAGVVFHPRHRWLGWGSTGALRFATPAGETNVQAQAAILALGGASWPQTGSDGAWVPILQARGVPVAPLRPANCGFDVNWSGYFRARFAGQPLKSVRLRFTDSRGQTFEQRGELVITAHGLEGSLLYAAAALLRDEIELRGQALISLDLAPDFTEAQAAQRLSKPRGSRSISEHWRRMLKFTGVRFALLRECHPKVDLDSPPEGAAALKEVRIPLVAPRPLAEAISTAGGVDFAALDENLMLRDVPGVFCAGEMLNWEAPTGGYLLTGCFATGRAAGVGALRWRGKTVSEAGN